MAENLLSPSVTGTRLDFANNCLEQAMEDIRAAADHQLYTWDLYCHQTHAASHLRTLADRADPGIPPILPPDPTTRIVETL